MISYHLAFAHLKSQLLLCLNPSYSLKPYSNSTSPNKTYLNHLSSLVHYLYHSTTLSNFYLACLYTSVDWAHFLGVKIQLAKCLYYFQVRYWGYKIGLLTELSRLLKFKYLSSTIKESRRHQWCLPILTSFPTFLPLTQRHIGNQARLIALTNKALISKKVHRKFHM